MADKKKIGIDGQKDRKEKSRSGNVSDAENIFDAAGAERRDPEKKKDAASERDNAGDGSAGRFIEGGLARISPRTATSCIRRMWRNSFPICRLKSRSA